MWQGQLQGGGLIYSGGHRDEQKQTDIRNIQEAKSTGPVVHQLHMGVQKTERIKNDTQIFGLNHWAGRRLLVSCTKEGNTVGGAAFGKEYELL